MKKTVNNMKIKKYFIQVRKTNNSFSGRDDTKEIFVSPNTGCFEGFRLETVYSNAKRNKGFIPPNKIFVDKDLIIPLVITNAFYV